MPRVDVGSEGADPIQTQQKEAMLSAGTDALLAMQRSGACRFCCGIHSKLSLSPAGEGLCFAYSVG